VGGRLTLFALLLTGCTDARPVEGRRGESGVHPSGITDPASADFHGKLLEQRHWDFPFCATCHGEDFSGGTSKVSCRTCHEQGPTACTTCHGMPPKTGAHEKHVLGGALGKKYDCSLCHTRPSAWSDPGHIDGRAETRCDSNCHKASTPDWNVGAGAAACGSCHGVPPANHPGGACVTCHPRVTDPTSPLHLDGKVSLGDDSGSCVSCHPNPGGAHKSHVEATHGISPQLACSECHKVPATITSPGHFSSSGRAEVFPSGGIGPIAGASGKQPTWDAASQSCSNTHCHGSATPTWPPAASSYACGSCHGVPPATTIHTGATLVTCFTCHSSTMDASGQIIGNHVNGVVDAQ
jgi:predicted CxxxxCH...CXXCH cytochrome family protein